MSLVPKLSKLIFRHVSLYKASDIFTSGFVCVAVRNKFKMSGTNVKFFYQLNLKMFDPSSFKDRIIV